MANRVANQIWPNLPQSTRSEVERPVHRNALAEAMYPRPKPKPTNPYRESLLKGLRELNARKGRR
jgi:hypothetical protein